MKKYIFFILVLLCYFPIFSQSIKENYCVLYTRNCHSFYNIALTEKNYKTATDINFKVADINFWGLFSDSLSCIDSLKKQKKLFEKPISELDYPLINSFAEIYVQSKLLVVIGFDCDGNYWFDNNWYKQNSRLTHLVFHYFSDEIINQEVLKNAKKIVRKNHYPRWHTNE